jgi:hypothetical protein
VLVIQADGPRLRQGKTNTKLVEDGIESRLWYVYKQIIQADRPRLRQGNHYETCGGRL